MPVLLLPVLLVAWAFATMHRRGLELRKPGAKAATPILLLTVLILTGLQSYAFARLYSEPKCDTRTEAGQWIAQSVHAGSTIGVLSEPWQFELPPMNARKYRIVITDLDAGNTLKRPAADYMVTSDLQNAGKYPNTLARVYPGGADLYLYHPIRTFQSWPAGFRESLKVGPQDMHYASPEITVGQFSTSLKTGIGH
jgi:hypothetical protein